MSTLVSPPRSLPRSPIVPRIVGAGEYSARLAQPHGHATHYVAIAGGERPSVGERYPKAGRWPGRRLVGFGSRAAVLPLRGSIAR
jgi:hypothetical protein